MADSSATALAQSVRLGLTPAPWTVRPHPQPRGRQHPWLWTCDTTGCPAGGAGVNEGDAHQQAAEHHIKQHAN